MCEEDEFWDGDQNVGNCAKFKTYNNGPCSNDFQVKLFQIIQEVEDCFK